MSEFLSTHPIGTVIELRRKRQRYTATLHRREYHGEEWRVLDAKGRYAYSECWPFVREHQAQPAIADVAAALNPPAGALADALPFALHATTPTTAPTEHQRNLFPDDKHGE